jgi:hypothetical protein
MGAPPDGQLLAQHQLLPTLLPGWFYERLYALARHHFAFRKRRKPSKYRTGCERTVVDQGRGATSDQPELEGALEILQEEMYGAGSTAVRAHGLAKLTLCAYLQDMNA